MPEILRLYPAILGSYPDGPETQISAEAAGQWSPWRHGSSSPVSIWQQAEPALKGIIQRQGFFRCYVYYGQNLPVELAYRVDVLLVSPALVPAPGPTFEFAASEQAHVWLRYSGLERLRPPISRNDFRELPLVAGQFATESISIGQKAWLQMYRTGLIFVEEQPPVRR